MIASGIMLLAHLHGLSTKSNAGQGYKEFSAASRCCSFDNLRRC